ncbi:hypothetical protein F2Q70_00043436 [Brassica cretica]|uniref:Uncharacterized protein n=1 Tax=Brassica cretica TaxID=69181 RepID=A0A8S9KFU5_BRACR|nr:hypothetical protein F2Q70_00043436 [Brassica cretica]
MSRDIEDEIRDEKNPRPLDEDDIALLKTYGLGPYSAPIKKVEKEIKELAKRINDLCGIKESDTGLAPPSQWDLERMECGMRHHRDFFFYSINLCRCVDLNNVWLSSELVPLIIL